jgi:predicted small integral membrane protein
LLSTLIIVRTTKILLLASTAFLHMLIVFNNLTDYQTNYLFTQHILSMDTTGHSALAWRAITLPLAHHTLYLVIIAWELAGGILCGLGAFRCSLAIRSGLIEFNAAKNVALCGLAVCITLWLFAFLTVAGEWFVMWQSPAWNGQNAALRMFIVSALTLIFLTQSERDYSEEGAVTPAKPTKLAD